jgi:integrase/recombinase XerD
MKHFIDDDFVLSPPPEGPLASYVIPFAQWLVDRGYGLFLRRNQVLMAVGFSKRLQQNGVELSE